MTERRAALRHRPTSLAYVKVGQENGGIVLNISETGLALTTAETLPGQDCLRLWLDTGDRAAPIEATGEVVWLSESKRTGGLRFVLSTQTMRNKIRDWIAREKSEGKIELAAAGNVVHGGIEFPSEPRAPVVTVPELPASPASGREPAEPEIAAAPLASQPGERPTAPATPADSSAEKFQASQDLLRDSPAARQTQLDQMPPLFRSLGESNLPRPQIGGLREGWRLAWLALASGALVVLAFVAGIFVGRTTPKSPAQNSAAATPNAAASAPRAAPDSLGPQDSAPASAAPAVSPPPVALSTETETTGGNAIEVTPPEQGSEPRWISLPQQAVSASESIAIAVRQSVVVPASMDESGDQPLRLEGGRITAAAPSSPEGISIPKDGSILRLRVTLDEQGQIESVVRVDGPAELIAIGEEIVRGWTQTPARLAGKPAPSTEDVTINFRPTPARTYAPQPSGAR